MFPALSATRPCGPESGVLRGYSRNWPELGSSRPSLLACCSVTQSAPSGATAGSWGRALGVGTSYSLISAGGAPDAASTIELKKRTRQNLRERRIHHTPGMFRLRKSAGREPERSHNEYLEEGKIAFPASPELIITLWRMKSAGATMPPHCTDLRRF